MYLTPTGIRYMSEEEVLNQLKSRITTELLSKFKTYKQVCGDVSPVLSPNHELNSEKYPWVVHFR